MNTPADRIAEVLHETLHATGFDYHAAAEAIEAALHLEETLVKEGETPPLYVISGWVRGATVEEKP